VIIARTATLRNAGRDAGAARGGCAAHGAHFPGGSRGDPFFIGPRFCQLRKKTSMEMTSNRKIYLYEALHKFYLIGIPLSLEGSKKVKKRRISRKSQVVCFYTAGWFTRRNLHFLTPPQKPPFLGSFFKIKLLH